MGQGLVFFAEFVSGNRNTAQNKFFILLSKIANLVDSSDKNVKELTQVAPFERNLSEIEKKRVRGDR